MPIQVACECGSRFSVRDELNGRTVACPNCRRPLQVVRLELSTAKRDERPMVVLPGGRPPPIPGRPQPAAANQDWVCVSDDDTSDDGPFGPREDTTFFDRLFRPLGEDRALWWKVALAAGAAVLILATIFVAYRTHRRELAAQEVARAVNSANAWLRDGVIEDAGQVEESLRRAMDKANPAERKRIEQTLEAIRQTKAAIAADLERTQASESRPAAQPHDPPVREDRDSRNRLAVSRTTVQPAPAPAVPQEQPASAAEEEAKRRQAEIDEANREALRQQKAEAARRQAERLRRMREEAELAKNEVEPQREETGKQPDVSMPEPEPPQPEVKPPVRPAPADDPNVLWDRATKAAEQGNFEDSARDYLKLLEIIQAAGKKVPPEVIRSLAFNLAQVLNKLGRYQDALRNVELGMGLSPTPYGRAIALSAKGEALCGLGRRKEGLAAFEQAVLAEPIVGRLNSADSLARLGTEANLRQAETLLAMVEQGMGRNLPSKYQAEIMVVRGKIAAKRGNTTAARTFFERVLRDFPDDSYNCGDARVQIRNLDAKPGRRGAKPPSTSPAKDRQDNKCRIPPQRTHLAPRDERHLAERDEYTY